MVVPAVPFVAVVLVDGLQAVHRRMGTLAAAIPVALFGVAQVVALGTHPWSAHLDGLRANRSRQTSAIRFLRAEAGPTDTVLDPSGMAYFLAPSSTEWYTDGLFAAAQQSGDWMDPEQSAHLLEADWVVYSYRLDLLPASTSRAIPARFTPVAPGLGALSGRRSSVGPIPPTEPIPLRSFWARRGIF